METYSVRAAVPVAGVCGVKLGLLMIVHVDAPAQRTAMVALPY
ncbi:hypothetical protein [Streptomyces coeruleorubidus]|uniref:Uncharacterized protein n=1 Tax=Streptomyces coeruleorubidus TaxID=116188 RepID=A0ABZ0KNR5_STRC4|nr:hypothetical protein [Streptomyces coeruleorubidus]WOT39497.1 hypothetical protein R5U08_37535 [Streptomyces coeruleorubidus]